MWGLQAKFGFERIRDFEFGFGGLKNAIALFSSEMTWGGRRGTFDPHTVIYICMSMMVLLS